MRTSPVFFLTVLLPVLSQGEVTSFSNCPQFFVNGVPPATLTDVNNNRYRQICQCQLDQNGRPVYHYATLYDTANKIPLFSAYEFRHADVDRDDRWFVEPQLDGAEWICMAGLNAIPSKDRGRYQAVGKDYEGSNYDKGHLYPVHHTSTRDAMLATSTLTNAAPQDPGFNRGQWRRHEEGVAKELGQGCARAFIVTGVVPGNERIGAGGVTVSKYYWSAYCCIGNNNRLTSKGFLGPNNNGLVETFTLTDLEKELSKHYGMSFSVFGDNC